MKNDKLIIMTNFCLQLVSDTSKHIKKWYDHLNQIEIKWQ